MKDRARKTLSRTDNFPGLKTSRSLDNTSCIMLPQFQLYTALRDSTSESPQG